MAADSRVIAGSRDYTRMHGRARHAVATRLTVRHNFFTLTLCIKILGQGFFSAP